jgi:predicted hydrolase (HD superfamily)
MDWSIACCDQLTGLIVAATLIHPEKKLQYITTEFVLNRYHERSFAKGADRKSIEKCDEKLNIPLRDFVALSLEAMQKISADLGL